jgi:adenine deaminase
MAKDNAQRELNVSTLRKLLSVSRGSEKADLLLEGCKVVNVFTREVLDTDIAVFKGRIAGIGPYKGHKKINCHGLYILPGFIDGHIHLESSHLSPSQFVRTVLPHGTTAVVIDPHEIANVSGSVGINWLLKSSKDLPVDFFFMAPSSVPASPVEDSGATLSVSHIKKLLKHSRVLGLAEVMDIAGILQGQKEVLKKVLTVRNYPVNGHAPLLSGTDLNAYIAAGIRSDHESTEYSEALEKLRLGMYLMIREGSLAKDMERLLKVRTPVVSDRSFLVSDDILPQDLLTEGHVDRLLRRAVRLGLDPVEAVRMVTLNPADYFGLTQRGGIAPGYKADIVAVDDLKDFRVRWVMKGGRIVACRERVSILLKEVTPPTRLSRSVKAIPVYSGELQIPYRRGDIRVIGLIPNSLITHSLKLKPKVKNGSVVADIDRDLLKVVVRDRYRRSRVMGIGFVKGFGLREGAIASTVAHDSHNIIALGKGDKNIAKAINYLIQIGGGMTVIKAGRVVADLPLPIGGLLSHKRAKWVAQRMMRLDKACSQLGTSLPHPFIALSFLALSVIPELKITDRGLVDVRSESLVSLFL